MTPKKRFPQYPSPNIQDLITVADPEPYFAAQFLFQQFGIVLVDLATGDRISGQVHLPQIGMIIPEVDPKPQKYFGFIPPLNPTSKPKYEKQNVDAVLVCEAIDPKSDQPLLLVVQVIDHGYLEDWIQLTHNIANLLTKKVRRKYIPQVVFGITSLCAPDEQDPDSALNAVLRQVQGYGFDHDIHAISHDYLHSDSPFIDEDEENEEEE